MHRTESWGGDADLRINTWEGLHCSISKEVVVEVEHVKAHQTETDNKEMSHFEKFVTEGNEKADELAKEGAMLDEGPWRKREQRQSSRSEKRCMQPCMQHAASFHCLVEE